MNNSAARDKLILQRSTFSQWYVEKVRFSDTDMLGHVNNASLATYFESGRTECILKVADRNMSSGIVFVVARLTINFLSEVHWPASVDIGTGILAVGRTSFTVGQSMFDGQRGVATAEAVIVASDGKTRKPCAMPDCLKERLSSLSIAV